MDNNKVGAAFFIISVVTYLFVAAISVAAIIIIHNASSMKNTLMFGTPYYVEGYIKRANELGIIKDKELSNAKRELNPNNEIAIDNCFDTKKDSIEFIQKAANGVDEEAKAKLDNTIRKI